MLGTLSMLWWAGLVFYNKGEYYSIPQPSIYLLVGAAVVLVYSLRGMGRKDKAERWYLKKEEL